MRQRLNRGKYKELGAGILRYNVWSFIKPVRPNSLVINLTYRCNSRCIMCNIWQMKPSVEMKVDDWIKVLSDQFFGKVRNLTITGGEVTLYPQMGQTVTKIAGCLPNLERLVINTNGFLPKVIFEETKIIAKYCQKKRIRFRVSISVDGIGKDHEKIRGRTNIFKKVEETISGLKELGLKHEFTLGISSLLLRNNLEKYQGFKEWLIKQGVDYSFQLVGFHDVFVNNKNSENKIGFGNKDLKLLEILDDLAKGHQWKDLMNYYWKDMKAMYQQTRRRTTPCPFLKDEIVIDCLGDVYYCLSVKPIGNIFKEKKTVEVIYFDPMNINFRKNLWKKTCGGCNSGCDAYQAIAYDFKKYLWYKLTGRLWRFN